jgi:protein involved in polysaccharide export with SLBB domain
MRRNWSAGSVGRALFLIVMPLCWATSALADYRLSSGDVLEVTVFRVPELSREATVDLEGRIAFPPLGLVDVEGADLAEVASTIRSLLARGDILTDAQVTVSLVTARPVYVSGDVASPGAYPFRASLSVRRAVALAGGLGRLRGQSLDEVATLRGEQRVLVTELVQERARLARALAELDDSSTMDAPEPGSSPAATALAEILDLEERLLASNIEEASAEREYLERAVRLGAARLETLARQADYQQRLIEQQMAELDRFRDIESRGLVSQARVTEEQRFLEMQQERAQSTDSEIAAVRQQQAEAQHALDRFDGRRRGALEAELREALVTILTLQARLQGVEERLGQLGVADTDFVEITIYRIVDGEEVAIVADHATLLEPGDLVEVDLALTSARGGAERLLPYGGAAMEEAPSSDGARVGDRAAVGNARSGQQ